MSSISSNTPNIGGGAPLAGGAGLPEAATGGVQGAAGATKVSELLDAFAGMAGSLPGAKDAVGGDGIVNANGAPALQAPPQSFSANDMIDLLRSIRSKSDEAQVASAKENLSVARTKMEKNNEAQLQKIQDYVKKCEEADRKGVLGKIFGWIGKIAALVFSAIAVAVLAAGTVATGGAGAPLLALAVMALIGSTVALADQISKECGGPEISLSNLMTTIASKFLQACGVSEETAQRIGKVVAGLVGLSSPALLLIEPGLIGGLAGGIAELAGADQKTSMALTMAFAMAATVAVGVATIAVTAGTSAVTMASRIAGAAGQVVQGATQIAQGSIKMSVAKTQNEAENIQADKKELDAITRKLQARMEESREEITKVIQQMEEGLRMVTQMINGTADSMSQITANIGKRMAV
ncbi:type III secretion system translocon subunit SctE [Achromobacter deleyi]|uniref:type III secretion system translocon subunit SctE n=1 Tax=Achromobacter deleyi TaxID=1353891 RepID=UPI0014911094|nr:type III secretion system translocon subunit SctE [Achromobacter deleyi]QVQ24863.1 type III secretion system translocon subunit SctE [Achromobacter deleyi]UIP20402.1 type III secretion system translocon subunit SctE [Achromobacter deleyi]